MWDVIDLYKYDNLTSGIVSLDQLLIGWLFAVSAFKAFGIGHRFLSWVGVLYRDDQCCLLDKLNA